VISLKITDKLINDLEREAFPNENKISSEMESSITELENEVLPDNYINSISINTLEQNVHSNIFGN
jgi:hypothetical protein